MSAQHAKTAATELHSELAQFCLPSTYKDRSQKLAWIDSICFVFLVIGLMGLKPPPPMVREVAPIEESMMVPIEQPPTPVTPTTTEEQPPEETSDEASDATPMVAVTLDSPAVSFAVPTVGNLLVSHAVSQAPPPRPMQQNLPTLTNKVFRLQFTGRGGDRPLPDYPMEAQKAGLGAHMFLLITVEPSGTISDVKVEDMQGARSLVDHMIRHVKRRFLFPQAESVLTYRLEVDFTPP